MISLLTKPERIKMLSDQEREKSLLERLKKKEIQAFTQLYREYAGNLLILAYTLLNAGNVAVQVVDELFETLWTDDRFNDHSLPLHHFLNNELKKLINSKYQHLT